MPYFVSFLATFFISLVLTGVVKRVGHKYNLVSFPRKRDIHKKPIPRIGGIAIFVSFILISVIIFLLISPQLSFGSEKWLGVDKKLLGIWLGGFVVAFAMLFDDIRGLKAWQKLFIQLVAVFLVIASGIGIDTLPNPFGETINLNSVYIPIITLGDITYHFSLWSDLLTIIWIVGMMNVLNFIDGIDGLASGIAVIAAVTIFILSLHLTINQPQVALLAIILAGASGGFLVWNFPPARIFMGDSGSMFLGFMLGVLPLMAGGKLATVFLVLGFPIVDGLVVAGGRIIRGKNPFTTPDKTHLHHRFIEAGFSSNFTLIFLYLIAIAFAWVALRSTTMNKLIAASVLILFLVMLILYLRRKSSK